MAHFPPLRNVDAAPVEHEGQTLICMQDPAGYIDDQVVLSPPVFFVAAMLDGAHDAEAIQTAFRNQYVGEKISREQIIEIVDYLDVHGFLHSPRFDTIRKNTEANFQQSSTRPAYLAGKSYPNDPDELRTFIDKFFAREGGPGNNGKNVETNGALCRCLIVPHIDFQRGGHCYAHGYGRLFAGPKPDTVFIIGVAHAGAPVPYILTRKHFETPFGTVETDQEILGELENACTWNPYACEYTHRTEHSIEFQAVMLAYHYGTDVKIVPILCAGLCDDPSDANPEKNKALDPFVEICQKAVANTDRNVVVIAGADLAHVGKRFGDPFDIDDNIIQSVADRDHEDLRHAIQSSPEAFYQSVMQDQNERRVCGLGCIYSALRISEGKTKNAELLHYDYAHDPSGGIVSFASVAMT